MVFDPFKNIDFLKELWHFLSRHFFLKHVFVVPCHSTLILSANQNALVLKTVILLPDKVKLDPETQCAFNEMIPSSLILENNVIFHLNINV